MVIDAAEAVLFFILVILTTLLIILGIQVYFILREFRKTVSKANKVLDDTSVITESVSGPITSLSTIKAGTLLAGIKIIKGLLMREKEEKKKNIE